MDIFIGKKNNVGLLPGYYKAREFRGIELWYHEAQNNSLHYYDTVIGDTLYVLWGTLYERFAYNPAELAADCYMNKGEDALFELDGEFLFAQIVSGNDITLIQCNYNLPDIYYRRYGTEYVITSDPQLLFADYSEADIDERSVFDYLSCGKMVGGNTLSTKVRSLGRGQKLVVAGDDVSVTNDYVMQYIPGKENWDIESITDELYDAYLNSIYKRSIGKVDDSIVFLSGGLDSRLLLSAFNELYEKKVNCVSFGQAGSSEVACARNVAKVCNNQHLVIDLMPCDFVDSAEKYIKMTAGMDQFPQSYLYSVVQKLQDYKYIFPGSDLTDIFFHAGVHRQYLNSDILTFEGKFSDYLFAHLNNARMNAIDTEVLKKICRKNVDYSCNHILEEACKYDEFKVKDIYTAFINNNDAAHSIAFRTSYIPGKYLNSIDPSGDKFFCKLLMQLPMECRMTDELHTRMIKKSSAKYLEAVYPNINMSVALPTKYWEDGIKLELQRERLYEKAIKEYNSIHDDKLYYTFYYSDFNGYSRYDKSWLRYIDRLLLDKESYIYYKWIDYDYVSEMIMAHRDSRVNFRKEIVLLASLEQFFRLFLKIRNRG